MWIPSIRLAVFISRNPDVGGKGSEWCEDVYCWRLTALARLFERRWAGDNANDAFSKKFARFKASSLFDERQRRQSPSKIAAERPQLSGP